MFKKAISLSCFLLLISQSFVITSAQTQDDEVDGIYCPRLNSLLRLGYRDGNTSGQVSELQQFIIDYFNLDASHLIITGIFGRVTRGYVFDFQKHNNLVPTGIVGAVSRAKIFQVCTDKGDSKNTSTNPNFNQNSPAALQCPVLNVPTCVGTLSPSIVNGCISYTCTPNQVNATTSYSGCMVGSNVLLHGSSDVYYSA